MIWFLLFLAVLGIAWFLFVPRTGENETILPLDADRPEEDQPDAGDVAMLGDYQVGAHATGTVEPLFTADGTGDATLTGQAAPGPLGAGSDLDSDLTAEAAQGQIGSDGDVAGQAVVGQINSDGDVARQAVAGQIDSDGDLARQAIAGEMEAGGGAAAQNAAELDAAGPHAAEPHTAEPRTAEPDAAEPDAASRIQGHGWMPENYEGDSYRVERYEQPGTFE